MLKSILNKLRGPQAPTLADREEGLRQEVEFWRNWFLTKGGQWPDDYNRRFDFSLPLQEELASLAARIDRSHIALLDVGAGPITRLGKTLPGKTLELIPTDVLADRYNAMLAELGVTLPVPTQQLDAETLVERFGRDRFDIVHAQNTVDHMLDAPRAIDQMLDVLRPGGFLYLRHEEREGQRVGYKTIHGWDFWLDDASGAFLIKRVDQPAVNITQRLASRGTSRTYREKQRVVFELQKAK